MASRDEPNHPWLREIDQYWKYRAVDAFYALLPLYVFLSVGLLAYNDHQPFIGHYLLVFLLVVLGVVLRGFSSFLRYECIRCPRCGFNPTRWETADEPLSENYMRRKLKKMAECPRCRSIQAGSFRPGSPG